MTTKAAATAATAAEASPTCYRCGQTLGWIHGHGACINIVCPAKGQNQAPCCEGETAG